MNSISTKWSISKTTAMIKLPSDTRVLFSLRKVQCYPIGNNKPFMHYPGSELFTSCLINAPTPMHRVLLQKSIWLACLLHSRDLHYPCLKIPRKAVF